jgi:protein O-GlcNAc transferase
MKKIISFSLWGDDPRYTDGAIRNAEIAKVVYPDWICRYHVGSNTPHNILSQLREFKNVEIVLRGDSCDWTGMFWRFEDASDEEVDIMISRDTDSRLTLREAAAVAQWEASSAGFHILRDHPYHAAVIMGGMWGAKRGVFPEMKALISQYVKGDFWQVDQNFLRDLVYPKIRNNAYVHDEFFEKKSFPYPRDEKHFIGQAYAGDDRILDGEEYFRDYLMERKTSK